MKNSEPNKEAKVADGEKYVLRLFIIDDEPNSARALINIKTICEKYMKGRYELDIIDLYKRPNLALSEDIIAIPVLIKKSPLPEIRLIGDLSDTKRFWKGLRFLIKEHSCPVPL